MKLNEKRSQGEYESDRRFCIIRLRVIQAVQIGCLDGVLLHDTTTDDSPH